MDDSDAKTKAQFFTEKRERQLIADLGRAADPAKNAFEGRGAYRVRFGDPISCGSYGSSDAVNCAILCTGGRQGPCPSNLDEKLGVVKSINLGLLGFKTEASEQGASLPSCQDIEFRKGPSGFCISNGTCYKKTNKRGELPSYDVSPTCK